MTINDFYNFWLRRLSKYRLAIMGMAAVFIYLTHNHAALLVGYPVLAFSEEYLMEVVFCGVEMFFLVSGFGVVQSLSRNSIGKFYCNRLVRIYPPVLFFGLFQMWKYNWTLLEFIKKVSGYNFWFEWPLDFFWNVYALLFFYFMSPLLYAALKKVKNRGVFISLFGIFYVFIINFFDKLTPADFGEMHYMLNRIFINVFGMYLGYEYKLIIENNKENVKDEAGKESWTISWDKILLIISVLILGGFIQHEAIWEGRWFLVPFSKLFVGSILMSISGMMLFILIMERLQNGKTVERIRKILLVIFEFYGKMSLELYIVHAEVRNILLMFMSIDGRVNSMIYNVVCFATSTLAAFVLYKMVYFIVLKPLGYGKTKK